MYYCSEKGRQGAACETLLEIAEYQASIDPDNGLEVYVSAEGGRDLTTEEYAELQDCADAL